MIRALVLAGAFTLIAVPQASAWNDIFNSVWGHKSNDTGGIIPWTPENERNAFAIADEQCSRHNKFPVASSIHRVYGDYIAYRCVWEKPRYNVRRYNPRLDEAVDMTVGTNGSSTR
jgi:hypothetical protein